MKYWAFMRACKANVDGRSVDDTTKLNCLTRHIASAHGSRLVLLRSATSPRPLSPSFRIPGLQKLFSLLVSAYFSAFRTRTCHAVTIVHTDEILNYTLLPFLTTLWHYQREFLVSPLTNFFRICFDNRPVVVLPDATFDVSSLFDRHDEDVEKSVNDARGHNCCTCFTFNVPFPQANRKTTCNSRRKKPKVHVSTKLSHIHGRRGADTLNNIRICQRIMNIHTYCT